MRIPATGYRIFGYPVYQVRPDILIHLSSCWTIQLKNILSSLISIKSYYLYIIPPLNQQSYLVLDKAWSAEGSVCGHPYAEHILYFSDQEHVEI